MEIIEIKSWCDTPKNYTGVAECSNGSIFYFLNRKLHREDGPAAIYHNGVLEYYLNGLLHREDDPAIIYPDGRIGYYLYGKRHRTDGPAVTYLNGNMYYYYLYNKNISTKEVNDWIKENNIPEVWNNSHKILFKLTFGR